jgi:hypothetical protein
LEFWAQHLPGMAGRDKPMWKVPTDDLLRRFKDGQRSVGACLSVDASVHGWGAILEVRHQVGASEVIQTSGRWGPGDHVEEQAHREGYGTLRAFETFAPKLQGLTVIHLTDCSPVKAAMDKGSKASKVLQKVAVDLWRLAARWSMHIDSHWIPGVSMLESGVDQLSREGAVDKHDVRVSDEVWQKACLFAAEGGMQLSVDWFADPLNAKLPRFWSRQASLGSAGVDAFTASSWGRMGCRACGGYHDYGAWVFPPVPLLPKVVAKLKSDRAHGVALVPFRPDTTWWTALAQACGGEHAITEVDKGGVIVTSHLAEPSTKYTGVNRRLCRFNYGADQPWGYAVHSREV